MVAKENTVKFPKFWLTDWFIRTTTTFADMHTIIAMWPSPTKHNQQNDALCGIRQT